VIVLDMSNTVAGGFCAKLLGMKGDQVIWCEDDWRPPTRGPSPFDTTAGLREYLRGNCGARREFVTSDAELVDLVGSADVVICGWDGGERVYGKGIGIRHINPAAVEVVVSSFGVVGPYSSYCGGPFIDWASGGYLYLTGTPTRHPLAGPKYACAYVTGYFAAVAAELGLRMREMGATDLMFDVATMDVMASVHQFTFSTFAATGAVLRRQQHASQAYPMDVFECANGWVSVGVVTDAQYDAFVSTVGVAELVTDPRFATMRSRHEHADAFDGMVKEWFMSHTKDQIVSTLQDRHVPAVRLEDCYSIAENAQLRSRSYWRPYAVDSGEGLGPGDPIRVSTSHGRSAKKAPSGSRVTATGDQVGKPSLPLADLIVIDVTQYWAGPLATRLLADMGATVIMIERPGSRFHAHEIGPYSDWKMNRGKLSLAVDLKTEDGRRVVQDLATKAQVLVENFSPGVMDRLGLGYETLSHDRGDFIYLSLSGFGQTGPQASWVSYGPLLEAASSIQSRTHYENGPPTLLGHSLPDPVGGIAGVFAVLNSLRQSDADGLSRHIDLSQLESYTAVCGEEILAASVGEYMQDADPDWVFRCKGEDEWIVIELRSETDLANLCRVLDCGPDARGADQITTRIREFEKQELTRLLQATGIASFGVSNAADLACDSGLAYRGSVVDVTIAGQRVFMPGFPLQNTTPLASLKRGAPVAGQHSEEVLRRLIGYDGERIDKLFALGVVAGSRRADL